MKIVLTGGASGLGAAITERLASVEGHEIYFTFCHAAEKAKAMEDRFSNVHAIHCDFTDAGEVAALCKEIESISPDVLIHNAIASGIQRNHFHKIDPAVFTNGFMHNILPVIQLTQSALNVFRKKKSGKIITILSSAISENPPMGMSEYTATKNYLLSLSKSWAVENVKFGISSNAVSPSFMRTPLNADVDERIIEEMENVSPHKRLLQPEEVAEAIAKLISFGIEVNGMNFRINAGENAF